MHCCNLEDPVRALFICNVWMPVELYIGLRKYRNLSTGLSLLSQMLVNEDLLAVYILKLEQILCEDACLWL